MAVTIQMIESKEFRSKANGYDPDEVDVFLDEIADEYEEMQREIQGLRMQLAQRQAAPPPAPAPAPVASHSSEAAQKILANAQRVSDETVADARKEADLMIQDAKLRADNIVTEARQEAERLQDSLDTLRSAANDYRARFKRLLDDQSHILSAETELFR